MKRNLRIRILSGVVAVILTGSLISMFTIWPQEDALAAAPTRVIGVGFGIDAAVASAMASFTVGSTFVVRDIEGALILDPNTGANVVVYEVELRVNPF